MNIIERRTLGLKIGSEGVDASRQQKCVFIYNQSLYLALRFLAAVDKKERFGVRVVFPDKISHRNSLRTNFNLEPDADGSIV